MYRVMMVCTGNICRSPMAEIVLKDKLRAAGLDSVCEVDSSGISDEEVGNSLDSRARKVLEAAGYQGLDVDSHVARQFTVADLDSHDLILTMTARHAAAARRLAVRAGRPDLAERVIMFRSFDPGMVRRGIGDEEYSREYEYQLDVEDPWYGGMSDFEECLSQVEVTVAGLVDHVRSLKQGVSVE